MNGEIGLCAIKGLPEQHCRKGIGLILFQWLCHERYVNALALAREVREFRDHSQRSKRIVLVLAFRVM